MGFSISSDAFFSKQLSPRFTVLPHKRFQLSKFYIYGHKISQGYGIMTDNLKRAGIFRKSVFFFLWCPFLTFTFRILGVFVDEL